VTRARATLTLVTVSFVALLAPAAAESADCLEADPPPPSAAPTPLGFGITPQIAGSAGPSQGDAVPEDPAKTLAALHRLEPNKRSLVLRLNRLFWADGREGIERFAQRVDAYAAEGFSSEVQIRYHPPEGQEGNIDAWEGFVRDAVRELASRPAVTALSITNEANLPVSPNTSDGAYEGVIDAMIRGIVAAREEATALGRPGLPLGFSVMWRWEPESDEQFWEEIGRKGTPEFRAALDYVGLQVYPGLVWPPASLPGRSAGEETVEALTLLRECYMPKASLGDEVDLWVSENGYATNLGRTETQQVADLRSTVDDVHRWSGTLGVTDYRYFNLRDNRSNGTDLFDAVGLRRDDDTEKPAFATYRQLVHKLGAP
jgi:hypothetical protein